MFMRISLSIFAPTYLLYRVLYCFVPLYFVLSFVFPLLTTIERR